MGEEIKDDMITRRQFMSFGASIIAVSVMPLQVAVAAPMKGVLQQPRPDLYEIIIELVSNLYGMTDGEAPFHRRTTRIVRPRQMSMYLAMSFSGEGAYEVGQRIDGRYPETVIYACDKIERLRRTDPAASMDINRAVALCVLAMHEHEIPISGERYARLCKRQKLGQDDSLPLWRDEDFERAFADEYQMV